jgi:hypothetical protein
MVLLIAAYALLPLTTGIRSVTTKGWQVIELDEVGRGLLSFRSSGQSVPR